MTIPRTFDVRGASVCSGDSGGPALSEKTGAVVGVYSNSTSGDCGSATGDHSYVNMSPYGTLALQAFDAAGAQPMREPPGLAMGEACQTAADCERGDCAAGSEGVARCTVACGVVAPCPTGFSCVPGADAGVKLCMPDIPPMCPCGSSSCSPCDAGVVAPAPSPEGGCAVAHEERSNAGAAAVFTALMVAVLSGARREGRRVGTWQGSACRRAASLRSCLHAWARAPWARGAARKGPVPRLRTCAKVTVPEP
jgi:hypothetical protein